MFADSALSDSDSDIDDRPNVIADNLQGSINETAASFRQDMGINDHNGALAQFGKIFSEFYSQQLLRKSKNLCHFELDEEIFGDWKQYTHVFPPVPNLYFLPITIIFVGRKIDLINLRNKIIDKYGNQANVLLHQNPKKKDQDQISIHFHTTEFKTSYRIRNILYNDSLPEKPLKPECLDKDLCLNPFFQFYTSQKNKSLQFDETCGCLLYWAYQKGLLNDEYFHENVLKMIVLNFYFVQGGGLANIIEAYQQKQKKALYQIEKMYKIRKNFECELDRQLFSHTNFLLRQRKTFYVQSKRKYLMMKQILPIPYPISKKQVDEYHSLNKRLKQPNSKLLTPYTRFLNLMYFLHKSVTRSEKISLDFTKSKVGSREAELDFNLEVIHPVLKTNMCENITDNHSKIRKIKHEIGSVVKAIKQSKTQLQAAKLIFAKH